MALRIRHDCRFAFPPFDRYVTRHALAHVPARLSPGRFSRTMFADQGQNVSNPMPEEITLEFIARQIEQILTELAEIRAELRACTDELEMRPRRNATTRKFARQTPLDW